MLKTLVQIKTRMDNIDKKLDRVCWREDDIELRVEQLEGFKNRTIGALTIIGTGLGGLGALIVKFKFW